MPVFGSRMVCETANYKYIEERDREFAERENKLARWVREKSERKAALKDLNERIRQASISQSRNNSLTPSEAAIQRSGSRPEALADLPEGEVVAPGPPTGETATGEAKICINYQDTSHQLAAEVGGRLEMGAISLITPPKISGYTRLEDVQLDCSSRRETLTSSSSMCAPAGETPAKSRACLSCSIM